MELAHIILKVSTLGSTVPRKFVSPAELMFLVADNHAEAGGDPVKKLEVTDPQVQVLAIAELEKQKAVLEAELQKLDTLDLTDEIREKREGRLRLLIKLKDDWINDNKIVIARRKFSPAQERDFLMGTYGAKRIKTFYPGAIPALPETFEEAQYNGVRASTTSDRLLTVGDNP